MTAKPFGAILAALAMAGACSSCSKPDQVNSTATNTDLIQAGGDEVAKVCSSQETLDSLKQILFKNVDVSNAAPPINTTYKDKLSAGGTISLEVPTLSSFDRTTKLVTCSARLTFTWPNDLVARLKTINSGVTWGADTSAATYTIQPQADGKGLVYSMDGPASNNIIGSVMLMLNTLAQDDAIAQARAEAAKAPPPASQDGAAPAASDDTAAAPSPSPGASAPQ